MKKTHLEKYSILCQLFRGLFHSRELSAFPEGILTLSGQHIYHYLVIFATWRRFPPFFAHLIF